MDTEHLHLAFYQGHPNFSPSKTECIIFLPTMSCIFYLSKGYCLPTEPARNSGTILNIPCPLIFLSYIQSVPMCWQRGHFYFPVKKPCIPVPLQHWLFCIHAPKKSCSWVLSWNIMSSGNTHFPPPNLDPTSPSPHSPTHSHYMSLWPLMLPLVRLFCVISSFLPIYVCLLNDTVCILGLVNNWWQSWWWWMLWKSGREGALERRSLRTCTPILTVSNT